MIGTRPAVTPGASTGGGRQIGGPRAPAAAPAPQQTPIFDPTTGLYQVGAQLMQKQPDGTFAPVNQLTQPGQVVQQNALGSAFNTMSAGDRANFDRAFGQQMSLADSLNTVIKDVNAPSVAREQLGQTLQANENTQQSMAAGSSGANAAIARTNAANNIAALNANAGADAALLRANEIATARGQLGTTLATAAGEAGNMYGRDVGTGLAYTQGAAATGAGDLANKTTQRGQNIDLAKSVTTGLGNAGAAAATGGGSEALQFIPPSDPNGVATLASDERIKHDIHGESDRNEEQFLRALSPKTFAYDGDEGPAPQRHGVMAQDVEKGGPMGKALIRKKGGVKGLDVEQGLGAALSALAYLHKRIEELENG